MLQRVDGRVADGASLSEAQQGAIAKEVQRRLRLHVQKLSLSRGGLADVIAAMGDPRFVNDDSVQARGWAVADCLFLTPHHMRAVQAAAARRARVSLERAEDVAYASLATAFARLAYKMDAGLAQVYARMPVLDHLPQSSVHGDIADVVRRGCGAGPFGRSALRRHLRAQLADANGHVGRGIMGWCAARAVAPAGALARRVRDVLSGR